jgi:predicted transcriptional regulator of viral defense system
LSKVNSSPLLASDVRQKVLSLVAKLGIAKNSELLAGGIHPQQLQDLTNRGELVRVGRGLYTLPSADLGEFQTYIEACARFPRGTICLLSALRFHQLTPQNPDSPKERLRQRVWMSFNNRWGAPSDGEISLRRVNMSGESLTAGVETHAIAGFPLRAYNIPKTIADCFKYRSAIGLDVALEALKEAWTTQKLDLNLLDRYARVCRVQKVLQPYLEMLVL